ncbi:MAG: anaerobic ribonucleoside-triphosphate reductase [Methanosphaera sp.]|nr:anaerobic ribonucleoside-triphosphate reductase [Methanosphaera sp.]
MKKVIKRDGRKELFDKEKIVRAVELSFEDVENEISEKAHLKAREIANYVSNIEKDLSVEEIQDIVEEKLMASNYKNIARNFITYRYERTKERERNSQFMRDVSEKLAASNVQNQNANVDEHSFGGRMGEARNSLMKKIALDYIVSDMSRENHLNNEIYIHDLDSYAVGMHNCLTIPFDKLLKEGFNTRQTDVRPARSINTAFQLVAVLFQLQSLQQFGGVSASHLDWTMVPYVRISFRKHFNEGMEYIEESDLRQESDELPIDADFYKQFPKVYKYALNKTEKELMQAVQGMYHNLNTLQSRSGNQLPFTSINYGTCTLPEGRMVIKALLEGSIEGVGKIRKTPIFPCGIFQCMNGINRKPGDPNYDLFKLALKSTSKRLYPNYVNVDWSVNAGYDKNDPKTFVSTMGCRTYNGLDINADEGTNPQTKDGRGNICPVTIIMPTLAMEADRDVEKFMKLLDKKIGEAKDMLIERYNYICSQAPESAKFMYENGLMLGYDGKNVESAMKHGTLALGQIGLAETLQILIGTDHTTEEGMQLAKRIEQLFKDRCAEFKKKYKLNIGVYYTPAENLCYTSMKKFKAQYGVIENVSDKEYFTNSIHVPVWKKMSPFEKIDIESQLTGYSNAGCITYVELDSGAQNNLEALEELVNYAMDKDIPYFAINVPSDTCLDCGYTDEFNDECPMCHSKHIQQLRRVTGYLTGDYKTAFNWGKQKEVEDRYKHSNKMKDWNKKNEI